MMGSAATTAMPGPKSVLVKRKRGDLPPDTLVVQESDRKRTLTEARYVRRLDGEDIANHLVPRDNADREAWTNSGLRKSGSVRRTFHLNHTPSPATGKRKDLEDGVATFVEKRPKSASKADVSMTGTEEKVPSVSQRTPSPLKRPGRGSAVARTDPGNVPTVPPGAQREVEALADYMHQAALEEIRREARPPEPAHSITRPPGKVSAPRISSERSRALHRQRASTNGSLTLSRRFDASDDDGDYVYDTYILAPTPALGATSTSTSIAPHLDSLDNVGYLVITSEDQSLWATYLEDDQPPSDKDWNSDEDEDENAEDYYGADYPEDELASDDEFDRGAYGYRAKGGASDDEEWDADTGEYSDEEHKYERMMEPWKAKMREEVVVSSRLGNDGVESE